MIALAIAAGLFVIPLLYQFFGEYRDARRYPPPGKLFGSLHVHAQGAGSPVVLFEAGIAGSLLGWALVQPRVAEFARAVSYDRAGLGWSAGPITPRTVDGMVQELAEALKQAQIPGPYILTGHSFGGLLIRTFAQAHPNNIAGLVLVDPVTLSGWAEPTAQDLRRLALGAKLSRRGAFLARWGIVRAALGVVVAGGRRLPKAVARVSAGPGTSVVERLVSEVRKLPEVLRPIVRAHWSRPQTFRAMAAYLECLPLSARHALAIPIPAHIPFIVLSAASATSAELEERDNWVARRMAAGAYAMHERIPGTGHWLQLERPDAVVDAIRRLADLHNARHSVGRYNGG